MAVWKVIRGCTPLLSGVGSAYYHKYVKGEFSKEKRNELMLAFGKQMLTTMNIVSKVSGASPCPEPVLLLGNHISYLDIPLLLASVPCSFVAKKEIERWPLVAQGCRLIGTVFVDRSISRDRPNYRQMVASRIVNDGDSIVLFPAGTTSLYEDVPWKLGGFKLAKDHGIKVQPFRLRYRPAREAAYIENDSLVPHAYKLLKRGRPLHAEVEFGQPRLINDIVADMHAIQKWCQEANFLDKFAKKA